MKEHLDFLSSRIVKRTRIGIGITALGLVSLLTGCGHPTVTVEQAQSEAQKEYDDAFAKASPVQKFETQYLAATTISKPRKEEGWITSPHDYLFKLGSACLQPSAFNVTGGSIDITIASGGIFSYSYGNIQTNIPAASAYAIQDAHDPNTLVIHSGSADMSELHFTNLQGHGPLRPADDTTKNILKTYGCPDQVPVSHTVVPSS